MCSRDSEKLASAAESVYGNLRWPVAGRLETCEYPARCVSQRAPVSIHRIPFVRSTVKKSLLIFLFAGLNLVLIQNCGDSNTAGSQRQYLDNDVNDPDRSQDNDGDTTTSTIETAAWTTTQWECSTTTSMIQIGA
jgi:hypothetical protein